MLQIKNELFQEQFIDMNLRERTYEGTSIVSLLFDISFYPKELNEEIISGTISVVVDTCDLHCLNDLENKTWNHEVKVSVSVSRNGRWEQYDAYDGILSLKKLHQNCIEFQLESKKNELKIDSQAVIVSLYSTSTNKEQLTKVFDMTDFYKTPIIKQIQKREITKYYVKSERE